MRYRIAPHASSCMAILPSLLLAGLLAGCGAPARQADTGPVFWPPPPSSPRVQFLAGYQDALDLGEQKKGGGLTLLVVGQAEREKINQIAKPYGVASYKGKIYVADSSGARVAVLDPVAGTLDYLKGSLSGHGRPKKPINLDIDAEGNLFLTDTVRKEVISYDASGNFVKTYGTGLDWKPIDVAADEEYLYVTDYKNHEVKVMDRRSGEVVRAIGREGGEPGDNLNLPLGIASDGRGGLWVVNMFTGRVVRLDRDGHHLGAFGRLGDNFGFFARPKGIDVDEQGRIYVVDAGHQNVQVFREDGKLLMFFAEPTAPKGALNLPAAIEVTTDNLEHYQKLAEKDFILERLIIVTSQFGFHKVCVYGMGKMKGMEYKGD